MRPAATEPSYEGARPVPRATTGNNPDAVDVKETQGDTASVLELRVAKEDLGRVIGKQGRTAKSIRTILNAVASRTNRKVVLEIVEDRVIARPTACAMIRAHATASMLRVGRITRRPRAQGRAAISAR